MEHRKEIDGLRAIAVLAIMFFHAGFRTFPGGYLGVDIFFVISGFLITGILLREYRARRFTLAMFYERRARRILPALFVMLFATAAIAYVLMLPEALRTFAQNTVAVVLFSSNVLFWHRSGAHDQYFEPSARLNPLLHTWSLGVEEQFYVLFPLLFLLCWRFGGRRLFQWVALTALASFVCSSLIDGEWGLGFRAYREANFYLLPTRAWQLALGAMLAFVDIPSRRPNWYMHYQAQVTSMCGLGLVLYALLTYNAYDIRFPSLYALAPTLGTALIIVFARGTLVGSLLSLSPIVAVGLWSYSAYLWHQPLFAFSHYVALDENLPLGVSVALCFATLVIAYASWRWVETPFRDRARVSRRVVVGVSCSATLCLVILAGVALRGTSAMPGRLMSERLMGTLNTTWFFEPIRDCGLAQPDSKPGCLLNAASTASASFMVVGDSHAGAMVPSFQRIAERRQQQGRLFSMGGCAPLLEYDALSGIAKCQSVQERIIDLVARENIKSVFLVARWANYESATPLDQERRPVPQPGRLSGSDFADILKGTIDAYARLGVTLYIVEQIPEQHHRPLGIYFHSLVNRNPDMAIRSLSITQSDHYASQKAVNAAFMHHRSNKGIKFIDLSTVLCDIEVCQVGTTDESYYADFTHLSVAGATFVTDALERFSFGHL